MRSIRRISLCRYAWILVFMFGAGFYIYKAVQFDQRVRLFNMRIQIGMEEEEIFAILGPPSYIDWGKKMTDNKNKRFNEIVYRGSWFIRDDLILYVDATTLKLEIKKRAFSSFAWGPDRIY